MTESKNFWQDLKSGRFVSMVKESSKGETLSTPSEVYNVMKPLFAEEDDIEKIFCIFLNSKNRVIAIEKLFTGSISSCVVYPREIIKQVLKYKASSVIVVHNHPSGNPEPSQHDKVLTKKLNDALSCIDVKLLDHIIVAEGYCSMASEGLMGESRRKF